MPAQPTFFREAQRVGGVELVVSRRGDHSGEGGVCAQHVDALIDLFARDGRRVREHDDQGLEILTEDLPDLVVPVPHNLFERNGLAEFCLTVFNANEFLFVE